MMLRGLKKNLFFGMERKKNTAYDVQNCGFIWIRMLWIR